ncbi:type IV pilin N-terminal domain-containing protein [Natrinema pallidum]|uniref:Uncharacterized protein n=1 Tax=Natrinema pallidum DSM 3751 TaxID=1227495 RepID=L9Z1R0_9EURY|nr:type IV pilin N-terminal domain-containing protein [Natrinema pallidum]ELY79851.1 hypothetical protein C487_05689 [Natrinema pallidum DSM 3751]
MRRRELLVGSGTAAAVALSGYAGAVADDAADASQSGLSADPESLLELLPAESALDTTYRRLHYARVGETDGSEFEYLTRHISEHADEIDGEFDTDAVSAAVSVVAGDDDFGISAASGSFGRLTSGDAVERGEWRIGTLDSDAAFASADGRLVVVSVSERDPTDIAETVVDAATGETDTVLVDPEATAPVFERLAGSNYVVFLPNLDKARHLEFTDGVASLAVGFDQPRETGSGTVESEYVFEPASDAAVDDDWITERLERFEQGEVVETTVTREGAFVHVDAVIDQPPERDRDAAPDARIRVRSHADDGLATIEHVGGESVDTADLEVWVDGELADVQLADDRDSFSEGDTVELETGPIADVGLRWIDESEDVYYYYDRTLVGSESFESSYDAATETAEITYDGDLAADPDRLEVVHRQSDEYRNDRRPDTDRSAVTDVSGSLTRGDTITVDDVTYGDRVSLELTAPPNPNRGQQSLAHVRVRPPRLSLRRHEGTLVVRYHGDQERDADDFRLLFDDEPADVQFADRAETLSSDTELEFGEVPHGTTVAVEWLEPDDPSVIEERVLRPHARVDITYDDEDGTAVADYTDGEEIPADDLELRINTEPADRQPADEYETFAPGDDLSTAVTPFAVVKLVWTGPEDTEDVLGRTFVGPESLDATYDPDAETVELVYTGEQPADPSVLSIDYTSGDRPRSDDREDFNPFSGEYDTLTTGDSVVIDDVAADDRITVMLVQKGYNFTSSLSIYHFTPAPRRTFTLEDRANGLVAVYRGEDDRDAGAFEFRVDGEPSDVQPADRYDTLTTDDEIELGRFDAGTEVTVEWVAPDDPYEVTDHVVLPDADFDIEYDAEEETVTVEHAGGDEIDAADLGVVVEPSGLEPRGWEEQETVSKGDTTTIDVDSDREPQMVAVVFGERQTISHERIDE